LIILGINCFGHDSAATFVKDGKVIFASEEERLNRKKHSGDFPIEAIKSGLKFLNIDLSDIDHVAFSWNPTITYRKIPTYLVRYWRTLPILLKERKNFSMEENLGMLNYLSDINKLPKTLKSSIKSKNKTHFKFHKLEHHLCHAASCFYATDFDNAAILTIDGAGEWSTTMVAYGNKGRITKLWTVDTPFSLGALYQAISTYLGFRLVEGPGKLMGLASYGERDSEEFYKLKKIITLNSDGKFSFDMSYFSYHYSRESGVTEKFINEFGPPNHLGKNWTQRELNIAAAVQQLLEEAIFNILHWIKENLKTDNLCMAGGVALNSVTNGLIAKSGLFKKVFIQPAAGDSGTSLGAALYVENAILKNERKYIQKNAFLGLEFSQNECEKALSASTLNYEHMTDAKKCELVAKKIFNGEIIGWFNGRYEFGPRALGNRSILASPLIHNMRDILNKRVKFRENFRPFAAIVLQEDVGEYFDCNIENPYMLFVYGVKEEYRKIFPSITHIDNSVRIQTVSKTDNRELYYLLKAFKKISGYSVLINTSFNIKGEPIVSSPEDAIKSYKSSDIDSLVINNFIIESKKIN